MKCLAICRLWGAYVAVRQEAKLLLPPMDCKMLPWPQSLVYAVTLAGKYCVSFLLLTASYSLFLFQVKQVKKVGGWERRQRVFECTWAIGILNDFFPFPRRYEATQRLPRTASFVYLDESTAAFHLWTLIELWSKGCGRRLLKMLRWKYRFAS